MSPVDGVKLVSQRIFRIRRQLKERYYCQLTLGSETQRRKLVQNTGLVTCTKR